MPADAGALGHGEHRGAMHPELNSQSIHWFAVAVASQELVLALGIQVSLGLSLEPRLPAPARLRSIKGQTAKPPGWVRKRN